MDIRTFAALAAGRNWLNKKRQEQKSAQEQREKSRRSAKPKAKTLKSAISSVIFLGLFLVYLVIEVIAALAIYMYINIYHMETFGYLIGLSDKFLRVFTTYLVQLYPDFANQAFATILGEMAPKSILLLLLGLAVSTTTRFMAWLFGKLRNYSSASKAVPPSHEPVAASPVGSGATTC
jgi:hypothetical protein